MGIQTAIGGEAMMSTKTEQKWSEENTIYLIQNLRNELIKDFLDERNLLMYYTDKFKISELGLEKIEPLKKELKELFNAPVDRDHYRELILQINETSSASISEKNEELFLKDVERILKKYAY